MKSRASFRSHPLHPILIAFPIAFFTGTFVVDIVWLISGDYQFFIIAQFLQGAGIVTALLAAVPGAIDFFTIVPPKSSGKKRAAMHGLINVTNVVLFTIAFFIRRNEDITPFAYIGLELVGMVLLTIAGWMGGTLVYRNQIGVDHRYAGVGKWKEEYFSGKKIELANAHELKTDQMKLIHIGGRRIVVAKTEEGYAAFDDRCTHRGGSLADGAMICGTVQCPWHGSQFDVRSGEVKAGPAKDKIEIYTVAQEEDKVFLLL